MQDKVNTIKDFIIIISKTVPGMISAILEPIIFILQALKDACDKLATDEEKVKKEEESEKKI